MNNNGVDQDNLNSRTTGAYQGPEIVRREFIKRFGKYAAGSAVGLFVLMSPITSKKARCASDGGPPP